MPFRTFTLMINGYIRETCTCYFKYYFQTAIICISCSISVLLTTATNRQPMPQQKPKFIFLDIDGVLNTHHHLRRQKIETGSMHGSNWCPIASRHVRLLCEHYDARIVISSTWRYNLGLDDFRGLLKQNEIPPHYLAGTTPALIYMEGPGSYTRGDEIARWLKENGNYSSTSPPPSTLTSTLSYVIIDDMEQEQFLQEQRPRLVRVHPDKGFAEKEAAVRAAEILNFEF